MKNGTENQSFREGLPEKEHSSQASQSDTNDERWVEPDAALAPGEKTSSEQKEEQSTTQIAKNKVAAVLVAVVSTIYLLNLTMGTVELPDMIPIIGNLDEAFATALLLGSLKYLGIDSHPWVARVIEFIGGKKKK